MAALASALLSQHPAEAHTWIDCIDTDRSVVYDKARAWIYGGDAGRGLCKGYMKNYPGRGDKDINTKMTFKILMDDVPKGMPVCSPEAADYSGWRHRIKVKPGEKMYYGYMDNGHNSKDKAGRGTFYGVYWTGLPGASLEKTTDLTPDKLIDGKLHDFDDGNCGQTWEDGDFTGTIPTGRAGNDFPCVGEITMPPGTKPGVYNLVWFWKFYNDKVNANVKTTGGQYGGAAYSSCFQVEVVAGDESPLGPVRPPADNEGGVAPTPAPPTNAPKPTDAPKPTNAPKPAETPKPTEAPKPVQTPKPTEPAKPTQAPSKPSASPTLQPTRRPRRKDCHA
ncbi:hypothetical protein ATCC90586_002660 [Pythium insidiosum]|nr:hypothetical protein ATCC90586_002660 [Pythium insidiosum]